MRAIDMVARLAEEEGATLVAVSLIAVPPEQQSQGIRLEHIQQSKDFLEAVLFKAGRHRVTIERYEVFSRNVPGSITLLTHEQRCGSIVLVSGGERETLLATQEKICLLENPPARLVLLRLPAQAGRTGSIRASFPYWLRRHWERQDNTRREHIPASVGELS